MAVPLDWDEATSASLDPRRITVTNLFRRLGRKADPWADLARHRYSPADLADRIAAA